jgi:hypothetical protein
MVIVYQAPSGPNVMLDSLPLCRTTQQLRDMLTPESSVKGNNSRPCLCSLSRFPIPHMCFQPSSFPTPPSAVHTTYHILATAPDSPQRHTHHILGPLSGVPHSLRISSALRLVLNTVGHLG